MKSFFLFWFFWKTMTPPPFFGQHVWIGFKLLTTPPQLFRHTLLEKNMKTMTPPPFLSQYVWCKKNLQSIKNLLTLTLTMTMVNYPSAIIQLFCFRENMLSITLTMTMSNYLSTIIELLNPKPSPNSFRALPNVQLFWGVL